MGTEMIPLFRAIKYFNKSLLLDDVDKFKEKVEKLGDINLI